jgi:hypothetical protein
MVYIDITSEFRNRVEYPLQSEFLVNINKVIDKKNISYGYPIYNFTGIKFNQLGIFNAVLGENNSYGNGNFDTGNSLLNMTNMQPDIKNSPSCDGYLNGCIIKFYGINLPPVPENELFSKPIQEYFGERRECLISGAVADVSIQFSNDVQIINLSNGSDTNPFVKILGGDPIFNFYKDYYLEDITIYKKFNKFQDRFKQIVKYDNNTRDADLESAYPSGNGGWQVTDSYRIRKKEPLVQGFETNLVNDEPWKFDEDILCNSGIGKYSNFNGVQNVSIVGNGHGFKSDNYYKTEFGNDGPIIYVQSVGLDGEIECFDLIFPGKLEFAAGDILPLYPLENNGSIRISEIGNIIDISPALQKTSYGVIGNIIQNTGNNVYNNKFIYIPVCGPEYTARINQECVTEDKYKCVDPAYYQQFPYNEDNVKSGANIITKTLFMSEEVASKLNFKGEDLKNWGFLYTSCFNREYKKVDENCQIVQQQFKDFIYKQDWEILTNEGNLIGNLEYNNSSLALTTDKCYNLRVTSLILPNVQLKSGGLISLYPSIYLEIYNVGSQNINTISSNNHNLKKTVFKFAITNIPAPLFSKFIKLSSEQTQSVKFNINDNIYFRLILGNGELFETVTKDNKLPSEVNPLLQLSIILDVN